MKFWEKLLRFFSKKDTLYRIPEEPSKIYTDNKERLIYTEEKSRSADTSTLTEIPKEEIELMEQEIVAQRHLKMQQTPVDIIATVQERKSNSPSNILISQEIFPKKCESCPDHKNYFEREIHQCPDCERWFCGRHYHGHIMKNHKSSEYTILGSDSGLGSYKIKK